MLKFIRPFCLTVVAFGMCLPSSAAPATTNPPTQTIDFPATPTGKLARDLVDALDSDAEQALPKFFGAHLADEARGTRSAEKYERMMLKLREQSGGVTVQRVLGPSERSAQLILRARKSPHSVGLELIADTTGQLRSLMFHPMPPPEGARPKPMSKSKVEPSQVTKLIEEHVSETAALDLFSGVVLVAKDDRILLHRPWGMAHRDQGLTNRTDTRFGSASVGKMFTGVAIAQLVEAGKLNYDDTLPAVLPDYPNASAVSGVTIHHLLTHTAGIGDPFDSPRAHSFEPKRESDWFPLFADQPPAFKPGAKHEYSNGGYVALAAIIEKVTGKSFADYLCDNVFARAGMNHTGCAATEDANTTIAAPHRRFMAEDPLGIAPRTVDKTPKFKRTASGMGGWQTTTEDLFRFARAFRTNRLLSPAMTAKVATGHVPVFGDRVQYGYGFYSMDVKGERAVGHSGGGGDLAVAAEVEMLWDSGYTVVILSNYDLPETRRLAHDILRFLREQHRDHGLTATTIRP
jgi:CubicO group peptidase (beta-lactamase class C family)